MISETKRLNCSLGAKTADELSNSIPFVPMDWNYAQEFVKRTTLPRFLHKNKIRRESIFDILLGDCRWRPHSAISCTVTDTGKVSRGEAEIA
jgi:hypothetical protein